MWRWAAAGSLGSDLCGTWIANGTKFGWYTGELVYVHMANIAAVNELQQLCKEFSE